MHRHRHPAASVPRCTSPLGARARLDDREIVAHPGTFLPLQPLSFQGPEAPGWRVKRPRLGWAEWLLMPLAGYQAGEVHNAVRHDLVRLARAAPRTAEIDRRDLVRHGFHFLLDGLLLERDELVYVAGAAPRAPIDD